MSTILGIPLLIAAALLSIPYIIFTRIYLAIRERRLLHYLRLRHRILPWKDVEQHLRQGRGTLVIEQAQKQGLRLWWTNDDIIAQTPYPPPKFDELNLLFADPKQPFVLWCFERYLSCAAGSAFLTRPVGLSFPTGFVPPDFFTALFPNACVVATTLTSTN